MRLRVFLSEDRRRAVIDELLDPCVPLGPREESLVARLQAPIVVSHEPFGTLTFERERGDFEGVADWRGQPIELNFGATSEADLEALLTTGRALWSDQDGWQTRVETALCEQLLALANDWVQDDGEPAMSADAFLRRISLTSIQIEPDDALTFHYDDGDVFAGHYIVAWGTLAGIEHCEMWG
ncbi:MAG: DUF2262 domain-containing protein [Myxococcota bacterium]